LNDVVPAPTVDIGSSAPPPGPAGCDAGIVSCQCVPPATLVAKGSAGLVTLRTDGINAYWITPTGTSYSLYSAPVDGSSTTPLVLVKEQLLAPGDLAVSLALYVVETSATSDPWLATVPTPQAPGASFPTTPVHIGRVPRLPVDLAAGRQGIYWTDDSSEVCSYLTGMGAPGCGGVPFSALLGPGAASPGNHFAVGTQFAYLYVQATGEILRVPTLGGGSPVVVGAGNPGPVRFLAGVDDVAFWANTSTLFNDTEPTDGGADAGAPFLAESAVLSDLVIDDPGHVGPSANVYFAAIPRNSSKGRPPTPTPQPSATLGRVWSASQTNAHVQELLACNVHAGTRLALDPFGTYLLWGDPVAGTISKLSLVK
jgi:hypothetical protein